MKRSLPSIFESESELVKMMNQEKRKRYYERLQALYLLKSGQAKNRKVVAESLGRHRLTIGNWLQLYEEGGLSKLLEIKTHPNHTSALIPSEQAQLKERLNDPQGFNSYGEIQDWIAQTFHKSLPYSTAHGLVRYTLKAKLKSPRKSHVNKDEALSDRFKKTSLNS